MSDQAQAVEVAEIVNASASAAVNEGEGGADHGGGLVGGLVIAREKAGTGSGEEVQGEAEGDHNDRDNLDDPSDRADLSVTLEDLCAGPADLSPACPSPTARLAHAPCPSPLHLSPIPTLGRPAPFLLGSRERHRHVQSLSVARVHNHVLEGESQRNDDVAASGVLPTLAEGLHEGVAGPCLLHPWDDPIGSAEDWVPKSACSPNGLMRTQTGPMTVMELR